MANMPSMSDLKRMDAQTIRQHTRGVLTAPLFVFMVGSGVAKQDEDIRRRLRERWSNAEQYLFIVSIEAGDENRVDPDGHYTISRTGAADPEYLYRCLTWVLTDWFARLVKDPKRAGISLTASELTALVAPEDPIALWAAPILGIVTELIYSRLSGSVRSRALCAYMEPYDHGNEEVLEAFVKETEQWMQSVPQDEMFYVPRTNTFMKIDGNITGKLIDRVLCLARTMSDGRIYDLDGERNELMSALIDPNSGIQWDVDPKAYSGFLYPLCADGALDIALAWSHIHEGFLNRMQGSSPASNAAVMQLQNIDGEISQAIIGLRRSVARDMHGFVIYDDAGMQELLQRLQEQEKKQKKGEDSAQVTIGASEIGGLFGSALESKFLYLWRTGLHQRALREAEQQWEREMREWYDGIWTGIDVNSTPHIPLTNAAVKTGANRPIGVSLSGVTTAEDICNAVVQEIYSENATGFGTLIAEYRQQLQAKAVDLNRKRVDRLHTLTTKTVPSCGNACDNALRELKTVLELWMTDPEVLIAGRQGCIKGLNGIEALLKPYEAVVNDPNPEEAMLRFLEEAREWLEQRHLAGERIPAPSGVALQYACTLANANVIAQSCVQLQGGRNIEQYCNIVTIALRDVKQLIR